MRGAHTVHSPVMQFLTVALAAVTLVAAGFVDAPAQAHTPDKVWKRRRHIKRRARSQIGAPYRYGGTSPRGFDCSGFTRWVFKRHGAWLPHNSTDQFRLAGQRRGYKRVWKRSRLQRGDLVFHKTTRARVGHVGVYIGRGKFISATSSGGIRRQSIWDPYYWGPRWVAATRVRRLRYL